MIAVVKRIITLVTPLLYQIEYEQSFVNQICEWTGVRLDCIIILLKLPEEDLDTDDAEGASLIGFIQIDSKMGEDAFGDLTKSRFTSPFVRPEPVNGRVGFLVSRTEA